MAKKTYDRYGFDRDGFNRDGFNRLGYNRDGYDRDGYNMYGYNILGFHKQSGRDKDGYDLNGYDINGFNRDGYDIDGFNRDGFNTDGFNRDGFNSDGFDKNGFDQNGFNVYGFDKDGYNRDGFNSIGFDRDGYNKNGFNKEGFNRDGFNIHGFDKEGFDQNGYDVLGLNKEGFSQSGFDFTGHDIDGFDILGFGPDGFDRNGLTIDGFSRELFDEEGYNILSGMNLSGYDRDGFNINGLDNEGYDRNGFDIDGYNREGYNAQGYNRKGFNADGYDNNGFNVNGFDRNGYDSDGFNVSGYDKNGYDNEGFNKSGYNQEGLDRNGFSHSTITSKNAMDSQEDKLERQYAKKCQAVINTEFRKQITDEIVKDNPPKVFEYIDRWGFIQREIEYNDTWIQREINQTITEVMSQPYIAHVNYRDTPELYLGKRPIHGWVTDWADPRSSLYYQYSIYIGNPECGLNYVREINFEYQKYVGYKDLYTKAINGVKAEQIADGFLKQILEQNQKNKKVHDIIESIQRNQYEIITADKEKSTLVEGCAGSGKTMILMHKIRYMKYNNPTLDMKDIFVISPTDILGRESKILSRLLQIQNVNQFTTAQFYKFALESYLKTKKIPYEAFEIVDTLEPDQSYYDLNTLRMNIQSFANSISKKTGFQDFYIHQKEAIENEIDNHLKLLSIESTLLDNLYREYKITIKELQTCGIKDLERIIHSIDDKLSRYEYLLDSLKIIEALQKMNCFTARSYKADEKIKDTDLYDYFKTTHQIISKLNAIDLTHALQIKGDKLEGKLTAIQLFQLFANDELDRKTAQYLLEEWGRVSNTIVNRYIKYLEKSLDKLEHLADKRELLQYLLDTHFVTNRQLTNDKLNDDNAFEGLCKLHEATEEILSANNYEPLQFFTEYDNMKRKLFRLEGHAKRNGKYEYAFDALLEVLGIEFNFKGVTRIPIEKAFSAVSILCHRFGSLEKTKKYLFIDEFQDFSIFELQLMKELYPDSVLNLYGDFMQCITPKGIKEKSSLTGTMYSDSYMINENYRNAKQITKYVNDTIRLNMLPVGLNGICEYVDTIPKLDIKPDDRVAIIVKNHIPENININTIDALIHYSEDNGFIRGTYNVISVSQCKGLEFEKVIVIEEGMTKNELYVAYTRAIQELYIVKCNSSARQISLDMNFNPDENLSFKSGKDLLAYLKSSGLIIKKVSGIEGSQNCIFLPDSTSFNWKSAKKQVRVNFTDEIKEIIESVTGIETFPNGTSDTKRRHSLLLNTYGELDKIIDALSDITGNS